MFLLRHVQAGDLWAASNTLAGAIETLRRDEYIFQTERSRFPNVILNNNVLRIVCENRQTITYRSISLCAHASNDFDPEAADTAIGTSARKCFR